MANTKPKMSNVDKGPFAYENWKAMEAGLPSNGATEFPLYTDAHIIGGVVDSYGPYQLINAIAYSQEPRLKPAIVLRMENHLPNNLPINSEMKTDYSRYHGGVLTDEIAALVSLCLGIRLECGACTREFAPNDDVRGRPVAFQGFDAPILPPISHNPILPYALGDHTLSDANHLLTLTQLMPKEAVALVRAARLFQDAVWISEAQPELSWIMLVSSVEVAAGHWRSAQDPPIDRLRASRPELEELLKPYGKKLLKIVAAQIADYMGSTKKFVDFLITFIPDPPDKRPENFFQHSWDASDFKKSFALIYKYRSQALHSGTPFPAPMSDVFMYRTNGAYPEKPIGLATQTKGGEWNIKDTPMLLHLFEYIVRKSLLAWWTSMVSAHNGTMDRESEQIYFFQDDDVAYERWLKETPNGFIVNCRRKPTAAYLVLHNVDCYHVQPHAGHTSTAGQYIRVACVREKELNDWATSLGGVLTPCRSCRI